jgi:hypothetical protein
MTDRQRPRYQRLAKLLRAQRVDVRVLADASFGLIHGKAGVIRYRDGGSTCFLGSINETGEAWTLHYELLWEDEDPASVAWVQAEFNAMFELAAHADTVLLATATPAQLDRMELYDLMQILHRGCERVLAGIGSSWVHDPGGAMDLVGGQADPPTSLLWSWLRDPLIPTGEHSVAT